MTDDDDRDDGDCLSGEPSAPPQRAHVVGYGKTPVLTRFRPGQSGNPRGRPKGARGLRAELRAELDERVTITQDGKTKRLPKRRVILKALAVKAAKGDVRAADKIISLIIQMEGFEDQRTDRKSLSDNDLQILDLLLSDDPENIQPAPSDQPPPSDEEPVEGTDHHPTSGDKKS